MRYYFLLTYLLIFNCAVAQKQQVVTTKSDTLENVDVKSNPKLTNLNQVTFSKKAGGTNTLTAEDVISFWDGKDYFVSYQTNEGEKLIAQKLSGILKFGHGVGESGYRIFFIKFENQEQYVSLLPHENGLKTFLNKHIDDFIEFLAGYEKDIEYNQKSLGEFVSSYNEFKDSSKYNFAKFKNESKLSSGLTVGTLFSKAKFGESSFDTGISLVASAFVEKYLIGPNVGFGAKLSFHGYSGEAFKKAFKINTAGIDGYLLFKIFESTNYDVNLNPGFSFDINYSGYQQVEAQFIRQTTEFNVSPISTGYFVAVTVDVQKTKNYPLRFFFEYANNNTQFQGAVGVNESLNGRVSQLAFGGGILF